MGSRFRCPERELELAGMLKTSKRPRDPNQLAKFIVDLATGEADEALPPSTDKDPAAVSLGRRGGLKGGEARARALTPEQRAEIARKAAEGRWRLAKTKERK